MFEYLAPSWWCCSMRLRLGHCRLAFESYRLAPVLILASASSFPRYEELPPYSHCCELCDVKSTCSQGHTLCHCLPMKLELSSIHLQSHILCHAFPCDGLKLTWDTFFPFKLFLTGNSEWSAEKKGKREDHGGQAWAAVPALLPVLMWAALLGRVEECIHVQE